jgi:hypothetical protein
MQYYKDYYERFIEYMKEIKKSRELSEISSLHHNFDEIMKVGENIGLLKSEVD